MANTPRSQSLRFCAALAVLTAALGAHSAALADIVTLGSVNPIPPAAGGSFPNTNWVVGDDDAASTDIRAFVSMDDGTNLTYSTLIVGDEEGFFGDVNIVGNFLNGQNTTLTLGGQGTNLNPSLQIGRDGTGRMSVRGAMLNLTNLSGKLGVGVNPIGVGHFTATDPYTIVSVNDDILVGESGIGYMDVLNGAFVETTDTGTSHGISIGLNATGIGTVVVDGAGSLLLSASNLIVGNTIAGAPVTHGQGTLHISNGGTVDVNNTVLASVIVGRLGRIELDGGTLISNVATLPAYGTTVNGYLGGSGIVRGSTNITSTGTLETNPGDVLRFDANVNNQGAITVNDSELRFLGGFSNNAASGPTPPGRITLENGTVKFFQTTTINAGVISSANGATNVFGAITNQGNIVVARDVVATYNDAVTNTTGTVTVLPGGNALFLGNLTFTGLSTLSVGVSTTNQSNTFGTITTSGLMALDGALNVNVEAGYSPTLGDSFQLMNSDTGISGTFDTVTVPDIPGSLEYGIVYNPTSLRMEVRLEALAIVLAGDYNDDGIVNALDYTVWRNHAGQYFELDNESSTAATPGFVDEEDFAFWKQHFGDTNLVLGSGGVAGSEQNAVPEPQSVALAVFAGVTLWAASGRRLSARR